MILSVFSHDQSLIPPFFADLQQFEGTEVEMHFSDLSAFSRTSAIAQERAKAFFLHLEKKLSTQGGNKSPLQILLERISKLPQTKENRPLIAAITQAFFKQRGYLSRLFSDESWEEWTENRTALGKVACLLGDCLESSRRVSHCTQRLDESVIQQANQEAETLLRGPEHRNAMKTTTFQPKRCITGLLGGILGSFLTQSPLPLVIGLSECFPQALAQQKIGDEFQVNTYIIEDQQYPAVAGLNNGNFVVTWSSFGQDGDSWGVYGQLFDGNGSKIGNEFQVNTYTPGNQAASSIASFKNGNFIVTWSSYGQDGSGGGIFGQLFHQNVSKIGNEFQVNTYTTYSQELSSVASCNNNNFVVTWQTHFQNNNGMDIFGQLFDEKGSKIGNEFPVNTFKFNHQRAPAVACLTDNRFVVTWYGPDRDGDGVYGQLFDETASMEGNEFQVNTETGGQTNSVVASLKNTHFVVIWQGGTEVGIYGQLFQDTSAKIGDAFLIDFYANNSFPGYPSVASFANSNFVVTWHSSNQGIFGQLFDSMGNKMGNRFQANTVRRNAQSPAVATLPNDNFVVVWKNYGLNTNNSWGIFGQVFHNNITLPSSSTSIFANSNALTIDSSDRPQNNRRLLWLWVLFGIGGCIAVTGYFLFKRRPWKQEERPSELEAMPVSAPTSGGHLSAVRAEKGHTRIDGKYDLINKISREEASELCIQTGITVQFLDEENRTKVLLGSGDYGKFRLARNLEGRYIGVKKVKGIDQIAQARNEIVLRSKIGEHPNILPIFDFVETTDSNDQPVLYLFMPLAGFGNGDKLGNYLIGPLDPTKKVQILTHVAKGLLSGLSHLHRAHIYHLNFNPSNIVFDNEGNAIIIDLVCAKELPSGQIREEITGDTKYFSPERIQWYRQLFNRQQPDPIAADKVDAWALGVSLLEMATGQYPFDRTGFSEKIQHWDHTYFQAKLDAIPLLKNPAPGSILSIVKGLLVVDPQKRLSIEDALAQLASAVPFSSPSEQHAAFAELKQLKPSVTELPRPAVFRDQDERYADVYIRKYGYAFTPDIIAPPGYGWTPDFVGQPPSSQASSASSSIPILPPSYEEVMRAE